MKNVKYLILSFVAGGIIAYFLVPRVPDVKQVTVYTEKVSKYWQSQYEILTKKFNQTIQNNIDTEKKVTRLYDENGKLKSEVTEFKKKDLSKKDTEETSTKHVTIFLKGETKEVEKIVEKTIYHEWMIGVDYIHLNSYPDIINLSIAKRFIGDIYLNAGYNIQLQPNIFAAPQPILSIENWNIGIKLVF